MSQPDPPTAFNTWVEEHSLALASLVEDSRGRVGADETQELSLGGLPALQTEGETAQLALGNTIGVGGTAEVRLAQQRALRRPVAVKRLRAGRDDPEARQGLLREALVQGRLDHPNIVPVHVVGRDEDGSPVLVMKRVKGAPWSQLLARPERIPSVTGEPLNDALEQHIGWLVDVCRALEAAHAQGVIHRDIKPDNIMIGAFGQVWLMDWGLAVAVDERASSWLTPCSAVRRVAGTPGYMAPEMARADGASMGRATDIYLLGATLYHVLCGHSPHRGEDVQARLEHARRCPTPDLPEELPRELRELCRRAMAGRPSERSASVADFRRGLQAFLAHRASRDLSEHAARAAARAMGGGDEPSAAERALFGYEQALRMWRGNHHARDGRRELLGWMVRRAVQGDQLTEARRRLEEIGSPDPQLRRLVEELAERHQAHAAELERLRDREDVGSGGMRRAAMWFVVGLLGMVLFVALDGVRKGTSLDYGLWLVGSLLLTGLAAVVRIAAHHGATTAGVQRIRRASWVRAGSAPLFAVGAWWMQLPLEGALALHLVSMGLLQLALRMVLSTGSRPDYSGYAFILGALALLGGPPWPLATYGCAVAAGHVLLGLWSARVADRSERLVG